MVREKGLVGSCRSQPDLANESPVLVMAQLVLVQDKGLEVGLGGVELEPWWLRVMLTRKMQAQGAFGILYPAPPREGPCARGALHCAPATGGSLKGLADDLARQCLLGGALAAIWHTRHLLPYVPRCSGNLQDQVWHGWQHAARPDAMD